MHGQLASGARCLNFFHMSAYLDPFFVCTSSEDSGQCAHVYTVYMQVCTHVHTFFVCTSSKDSGQCAHACTLAWAFFMEAAIINNI